MNFASDNWAGAHPQISEALAAHAPGFAAAYGSSTADREVERIFCEIFEHDVSVFFVGTGTAANALAMTAFARPGGVAFCHREAHMLEDECGAPEYFTGGGRLFAVDGSHGRMDPRLLDAAIRKFPAAFVHAGQPAAVSLTQSTEIGTVYGLEDIAAIAGICRSHSLPLHMDGARFANALVALETTPAEMTWRRGVDVVSFGATKNGCWCAEALVFMDPARAEGFPFLRKRAAQLFSKSRFISAQFEAYFRDDLWLNNAAHSNAMAARLAGHVGAADRARLAWQPQANEVFAILSEEVSQELGRAGAVFYPWNPPHGADAPGDGETMIRLVTSFATTIEEVERFGALLRGEAD